MQGTADELRLFLKELTIYFCQKWLEEGHGWICGQVQTLVKTTVSAAATTCSSSDSYAAQIQHRKVVKEDIENAVLGLPNSLAKLLSQRVDDFLSKDAKAPNMARRFQEFREAIKRSTAEYLKPLIEDTYETLQAHLPNLLVLLKSSDFVRQSTLGQQTTSQGFDSTVVQPVTALLEEGIVVYLVSNHFQEKLVDMILGHRDISQLLMEDQETVNKRLQLRERTAKLNEALKLLSSLVE